MSRDQRRRLLRQLRDSGFSVRGGKPTFPLDLGPPHRHYRYPGWPEIEAEMLADWDRHREVVMAEASPWGRPWGYFWFDRDHADTIPGPQRDRLLAEGRLTAREAEHMAWCHGTHAWAQIAAARPGETTADWLADPALIAKTIALIGWNPFTEETIAYLRANYPSPEGQPTPEDKETP